MEHESRLTSQLRRLLHSCRTAALGTIDAGGGPHVSRVPFAVDVETGRLVLLISGLAAHTSHIRRDARISLLIAEPEQPDQPVHALGRMTLTGRASVTEPGSADAEALKRAYLQRFPEAEPIARLPDFRCVAVQVHAARQVADFGAARDVSVEAMGRLLRSL